MRTRLFIKDNKEIEQITTVIVMHTADAVEKFEKRLNFKFNNQKDKTSHDENFECFEANKTGLIQQEAIPNTAR